MMNVLEFRKRKQEGPPISMVTAYDHWSARIVAASEVDCILVGDSVAMVVHGHPSTLAATTEMMATHTRAVTRGSGAKFVVADMPFLSFRKGPEAALDCVGELMRAGAHSVKLEGVWGHEETIIRIVESGVPVMGHLGLTPQSIHRFGGFKVQGRGDAAAEDLLAQARKLDELGCFAIVLECVPSEVAARITEAVSIPTIGIGAGARCDGQVLVLQDLLGMSGEFKPRFLRRYLEGETLLRGALDRFAFTVREREFPNGQESYE
jgi:3-methyl-2-oxobutanoate hydroxymethyltransferase